MEKKLKIKNFLYLCKMKLSDRLTKAVYRYIQHTRTADIVVPNIYIGKYELDIMQLKKSGILVEYEIKISRADFFNDFKKGKHLDMANKVGAVNKFYYVVPKGLVSKEEVPSYAGLIYIHLHDEGDFTQVVKNTSMIHKERYFKNIEQYHTLASKLSFRENNWRACCQNK